MSPDHREEPVVLEVTWLSSQPMSEFCTLQIPLGHPVTKMITKILHGLVTLLSFSRVLKLKHVWLLTFIRALSPQGSPLLCQSDWQRSCSSRAWPHTSGNTPFQAGATQTYVYCLHSNNILDHLIFPWTQNEESSLDIPAPSTKITQGFLYTLENFNCTVVGIIMSTNFFQTNWRSDFHIAYKPCCLWYFMTAHEKTKTNLLQTHQKSLVLIVKCPQSLWSPC